MIDPKALEAARAATSRTRPKLDVAITAHLDAADLVGRSELRKGWHWVELMEERDEARAQVAVLREALEDMLENFGVPYDGHLSVETARAVLTDTAPEEKECLS